MITLLSGSRNISDKLQRDHGNKAFGCERRTSDSLMKRGFWDMDAAGDLFCPERVDY